MAFVNEKFTPEDRARYHFDDFEREQVAFPNPSRYWAIDRGAGIFLRMVRPTVGDNFDPDSGLENQFHFHRHGYDYLVHTRAGVREDNLAQFPGTLFVSGREPLPGSERFLYYLRFIAEINGPSPSALRHHRQAVLTDLEVALDASFGGFYMYIPPERRDNPRHIRFIIAPGEEYFNDGGRL
ncbi:hypothetical protein [Citrobacter amalonaticus]|uniref:hypothetical protein n=1 Tax=Citrobacter amalonaticus TaxID=35703 RepID=UPI0011AEE5E0|nr:hypothetical protein [Citrobacter amalonaticus]